MQHIRVRKSSLPVTNNTPETKCNDCKTHNGLFIPQWLWVMTEVTATEKLIWAVLTRYCNEENRCHPSQSTIAKELDISRKTVNEGIEKLCKLNLITKFQPQGKEILWHWNCAYKVHTFAPKDTPKEAVPIKENPVKKMIKEKIHPVKPVKSDFVCIYNKYTDCWPNKIQEAEINKIVKDKQKWENVLHAWLMKKYSPVNVSGMLDWYINEIPKGFTKVNIPKQDRETFASRRDPAEKYKNVKTTIINTDVYK